MQSIDARVLVVGGSSGISLAVARRCLGRGCDVTIVGRSHSKLDNALALSGQPSNLACIAADFTDESQVAEFFKGSDYFDHIVSTAASLEGAYRLLSELDMKAARQAIESKVIGPLLLAKYGSAKLRDGGSITFTSGIAAYRPMPRGTVVAAVNAALEGLVRALAVELAPIRVNAVSPGWIDTPIWTFVAGDKKDETLAAMGKRLPVGRIGQPDDIAEAIEFLMGNGFSTGSVLHVEGGHRLI